MCHLCTTFSVSIRALNQVFTNYSMKTAEEKTTYAIPLEGVESEHGAQIIAKGLKSVAGITTANVELNNNRAMVAIEQPAALTNAVKKIRDLGYGVTTIKQTIPVLNMSCASCATSAESMVAAQPGVVSASVNYASGNLLVEYLPNLIRPVDLQHATQAIGYDLLIPTQSEQTITIEDIQHRQYAALKAKAIGATVLSVPLVIIGMFLMNMPFANEVMWVLSTPVVVWWGRTFFINAWKQARHFSSNMDTLVALSTGVAYTYSVFNTIFPQFWHQRGIHGHVYFEAAAVVIAFILIGKLLEEKAKGNTSTAIKKLMTLQPKTVLVMGQDGVERETPVDAVKKGDLILVKPGQQIAVDGIVSEGHSFVDESMLNGEPTPVYKQKGDSVFAGTINQKGSFQLEAQQVGAHTLLAHIIRKVQEAQGSKAPVQLRVDQIAAVFVPVVLITATLSLLGWWMWGGDHGFTQGLNAFVTVLVIACPCALGLATPTAIMVGVGKGAENGILIRDAESLEKAKMITIIVLDKTGTITEGKPTLTDLFWLEETDTHRSILVGMEKLSEHPLAQAVVNYFGEVPPVVVTGFESITGKGVKATVDGQEYYVGSKRLLTESNITISNVLLEKEKAWSLSSKTIIWFANQTQALAVMAIADPVKATSAQAIQSLHEMDREVIMLTGDQEATAKNIAQQVGITQYHAGFLPHEKADFIKELQLNGKVVAMVGDGINDSAALAQADVSIAMGKGSDIAMEVAKMTIISSDLSKIPMAIQLSKRTVSTIRQNLFWAFIYNVIGIPIAAGILYPINGFTLNPMIAGAAMALSSVSVVSNSLRLKWIKM